MWKRKSKESSVPEALFAAAAGFRMLFPGLQFNRSLSAYQGPRIVPSGLPNVPLIVVAGS